MTKVINLAQSKRTKKRKKIEKHARKMSDLDEEFNLWCLCHVSGCASSPPVVFLRSNLK